MEKDDDDDDYDDDDDDDDDLVEKGHTKTPFVKWTKY